MSSTRLFILDALERVGEMHGHQLRQLAEKEHVDHWTDITVGGLYGTLKRLAAEELIEVVRTEQIGGYPERQVWGLTRPGRVALARLRNDGLRTVVFRTDPFDLAMSRLDGARLDAVPALLDARRAELAGLLADAELQARQADPYLSPLERTVIGHRMARLRAEIAWHDTLAERLPELLADEARRQGTH